MQRNLVISPTAASSSIEITEIDLGSALFAYNNVFIALLNYRQYKLTFTYCNIIYIIRHAHIISDKHFTCILAVKPIALTLIYNR